MKKISQQTQPQNEPKNTRDYILIIATVLGSIIAAIILGTIHIVDFNWIMLVLGCIMLAITVLFGWYNIRSQKLLRKQYEKDVADLDAKFLAHQIAIRDNVNAMSHRYQSTIDAIIRATPPTITVVDVPPRKPH